MPRAKREKPWLEVRNEVYYVFWHAGKKTERLSLRTTDFVEAQTRFCAFLTEGLAIFDPGPEGLTVGQALSQYVVEHVDVNCAAPVRQHSAIKMLRPWFGDTPISQINVAACRAYVKHRRIQGKSDSTIRRELTTLRAAIAHAIKFERLDRMPKLELPTDASREAHWFTKPQFQKIVANASPELRDLVIVLYYTAARRESVVQMTKFQVNLKDSRIDLRNPNETLAQRRSKKRRVVVPLDPALRPTIERLMMQPGERLFPQVYDWYVRFQTCLSQLGFEGTLHSLRHSRATHLLQAGVSVYDVASLLGDTVETVQRVYAHACPDHVGEAIRRATG
jgi:integrase